jgi:hypothetical protein
MKLFTACIVAVVALATAGESYAQTGYAKTEMNRINAVSNPNNYTSDRIRHQVISNSVAQVQTFGTRANVLAGALSRPNKPFSSISRGPSVTPYLALDQPFANTATQYYTQIRPQLEQQRINQQVQRQTQQMQRQLSEVTARPPYDPQGNENMMPTGHSAGFMTMSNFMNYGGYYQQPRPQQRR